MKLLRTASLCITCLIAPFMLASMPETEVKPLQEKPAKEQPKKKHIVKKASHKKEAANPAKEKKAPKVKRQKVAKKEADAATVHAIKEHTKGVNKKELEPKAVKQGEVFTVTRPASPNFGRTWQLHKKLPAHIEQVGEPQFVPAEQPGRNEGNIVYSFKGVKPGSTKIEFEKIYPEEVQAQKPLKVRVLPVEIKE